ncbi:hypothetical protein E2C01_081998 [Portunus trituberculatus]|uniref:Uncharacterized protein n=1 Tax=Portunus trituberculatus TaxID=210409 RepID=A0A5B7IZM1_PORTR|nr:hypothetical protein [Portunus trituberculatus]
MTRDEQLCLSSLALLTLPPLPSPNSSLHKVSLLLAHLSLHTVPGFILRNLHSLPSSIPPQFHPEVTQRRTLA